MFLTSSISISIEERGEGYPFVIVFHWSLPSSFISFRRWLPPKAEIKSVQI